MSTPQQDGRRRVIIEGITPEIDGGRFAAKRVAGDVVRVEADVFVDGHDSIAATVRYRHQKAEAWSEQPMQPVVNDRWFAEFPVSEIGRYHYTVHAWVDHFETWRRDLLKRIQAQTDTDVDYLIGVNLIVSAAERAEPGDAVWLQKEAQHLRDQPRSRQKAGIRHGSAPRGINGEVPGSQICYRSRSGVGTNSRPTARTL